jgi:hypothetical protein
VPHRVKLTKNVSIECDLPEEALDLVAKITTRGNMDQMMRDVRRSVLGESIRRLGPVYIEEFEQLTLEARQAAEWKQWALELMAKHGICDKSALEEDFDIDQAQEAIDTAFGDLKRIATNTNVSGPVFTDDKE